MAAALFAGALGASAVALQSCASGSGHPPTARIALDPAYVALGDGYATDVTLDASASSDAIDDPRAAHPLAFAWTIEDPAARFSPDAHSPRVTVRTAGARPVAVHLTITDADGDQGAASATIGVTLP